MITLKRSKDRLRVEGFRTLTWLREDDLEPGQEFEVAAEVLTYVCAGSVRLEDASGRRTIVEAGECHRSGSGAGRGVNVSPSEPARIFQCHITPDRRVLQTPAEQRRFPLAERRGLLRLLASRTGRGASLRLRQDAGVYSSILDPGHHLVHELSAGRAAWLHVVKGRIQLVDQILEAGDGASLVEEAAVSLTAREPSEILLFDLV